MPNPKTFSEIRLLTEREGGGENSRERGRESKGGREMERGGERASARESAKVRER